jgi:hypothetical protein
MSLGFITESALLPRKSKKVDVDQKSIVGLKSLVYEKEQALRSTKDAAASLDGEGLRALRGKRALANQAEEAKRSKNDIFTRKNVGVSERHLKDEAERETPSRKLAKSRKMLEIKSRLYNKLASAAVPSEAGAGLLVDFDAKTPDDTALLARANEAQNEAGMSEYESDVEVVDEFGRTRRVKKGSETHIQFMRNKAEEERYRREERTSSRSAGPAEHESDGNEGGSWAWGSGSRHPGRGLESSLAGRRAVEELLREEGEHLLQGQKTGQRNFRMMSRWDERKLGDDQKAYIDELRAEQREAPQKSAEDRKRERLKLLEKKMEAKKSKSAC